MQTAAETDPLSAPDYLAEETGSRQRHEYLGGMVFALPGETVAHNQVEIYAGTKAVAVLKSLKLKLPLKDIYEGV